MVMNNNYLTQEMATAQPAQWRMVAETETASTLSTYQMNSKSDKISSAELAQKVLKMTGSVRLAARSAGQWHHCGINE
jgi:hypothetical protein